MSRQGWIRRMIGTDAGGTEPASVVADAPGLAVRAAWRRLWPYARPYRVGIGLGLALVAVVPAIQTAEIWLFKVVVDEVFTPRNLEPFPWIAAALIGLNLLSGLVSFGDEYLATSVAERSLLELRRDLFRRTIDMPPHALDRRPLGDLVTRFTSDVSAVETLLISGPAEAIAAITKIVFFTGALFWLDPLVAAASLVVAPLFWMSARTFSERIRGAARAKRSHSGSLASVAEEGLSNAPLIQSFNRQEEMTERFVGQNRAMVRAELEATRIASLFGPLVDAVELVGGLVVIGLGTWALASGRLSLGGLLAFLTYLSQLYRPVRDLTELSGDLFAATASAERVIELLDAEPGVAAPSDAPALRVERGEVDFDAVTFTYPGATRPAVHEVSATARAGELVAFAGPSGAGKSTLAKLLLRFFDPDSGRVTVDGQDLAHVRLDSVRSAIAFVPQESLVFDGTIWDNIAFAAPEASDAAVLGAAAAAGLDEWASTLPKGYATVVGQKGRSLSGGQRQRLAIARALLRDAAVLLLDEPTTGLDGRSREGIMQTVGTLARTKTVVLISHDLPSVRRADRIYVLVEGRVVEEGAHDELMALGGAYARLWGERGPGTTVSDVPAPAAAGR